MGPIVNSPLFWIIIIALAIYRIFRPRIKGFLGEKTVAIILGFLNDEEYKVLNNIMVEVGEGKTSQIDHIVVSNYGIFLIETKNYAGWIYGSDYDRNWTQVIYRRKEKIINPVRQNRGHIQALTTVLADYPELKFIPIVSFSTKATLKTKTTAHVVYSTRLIETIDLYDERVMSDGLRDEVYEKIAGLNIVDRDARKEHIESIQSYTRPKNQCPRCGNQLVLRKGKYGDFLGCSNFPKCRYTAPVQSEEI